MRADSSGARSPSLWTPGDKIWASARQLLPSSRSVWTQPFVCNVFSHWEFSWFITYAEKIYRNITVMSMKILCYEKKNQHYFNFANWNTTFFWSLFVLWALSVALVTCVLLTTIISLSSSIRSLFFSITLSANTDQNKPAATLTGFLHCVTVKVIQQKRKTVRRVKHGINITLTRRLAKHLTRDCFSFS